MRSSSRMQILRQVQKNMTYESIRFNNKQISDQLIKATIEQYFPKIFANERWRQLTFFTKAMKDEEFYKKIRALVSTQLSLQQHLQDMQQRQLQKSKIQDYSSSHGVEERHGNKKMTRAALARRNQQTQEQLRKDQIYVRLTPKTQQCLKWMLCNRKFPRIECKLSCNQHIEYLVNYLSNKWLSSNKGNNRIVLYPDVGSFLKNNLSAKQRQKILKEPLNNFYMFTDVMIGSGIGQNGILNLHYEILEKKKDVVLGGMPVGSNNNMNTNNLSNSRQNNSGMIIENSLGYMDRGIISSGEKKHTGYIDNHGQMIHTDTYHNNISSYEYNLNSSNNKRSIMSQRQDDLNNNNRSSIQQYVPVGTINTSKALNINANNNSKQNNNGNINMSSLTNNNGHSSHLQNNNNQINQSSLLMNNAHYSNHFLSNQSNLLNPNRSIYHDQQSIFKSIGFFALGSGNNSYGFQKKNDFHLLTVNSNSYIDVGMMNQLKQREKQKQKQKENKQIKQIKEKQKENDSNKNIVVQERQKNTQVKIADKQKQHNAMMIKDDEKVVELKIQQLQKDHKQQKQQKQKPHSSSSPRQVKIIKPIPSSPKKDFSFNTSQKKKQKQKQPSPSYNLQQISQIKQQSIHDIKKHQQKLLDLRNAINLLQQEVFNEVKNEEISQKQQKQVKTVSIKKKLAN